MQFVNPAALLLIKAGATFDFDYHMKNRFTIPAIDARIYWARNLDGPSKGTLRCHAGRCPGSSSKHRQNQHSMDQKQRRPHLMMAKHGPRIIADISNYANITPLIQIDGVLTYN